MRTADFDYYLPRELIAQAPAASRDESRLLVLHRRTGEIAHRVFREIIEYLNAGDLLVLNDSRVIPARLRGRICQTTSKVEVLLLEEIKPNLWWALVRPAKRAKLGTQLSFANRKGAEVTAEVASKGAYGQCQIRFTSAENIAAKLKDLGEVPLPPYIHRKDKAELKKDAERYQTVYARKNGSVAAPTAGLHFTEDLLERIRAKGVDVYFITLHIGLGTFAPVRTATVEAHQMHEERYEICPETAAAINQAKKARRRVVAVGTSTVRVLESVAASSGGIVLPGMGRTGLFIYPPFKFRVVDALVTNFHLPRSTLLMLVSAFAAPGETRGRDLILRVYQEAIRLGYRFYSYGDAMLIL